jgi:hypothetical protein
MIVLQHDIRNLIYAKTADSPKQGNFGFDMVKT